MARILVLTTRDDPLPALPLLAHSPQFAAPVAARLHLAHDADVVIVDAVADLAAAHRLCRTLETIATAAPVIAVVDEAGMAAVGTHWAIRDVIVHTAGPAEVDARLRLAVAGTARERHRTAAVEASGIVIDEQTYSATLRGRVLDLTFREFQLLLFFAAHPARVFTREELLDEVWGDDYFGGTRTVDVHVRRLRAKLGDAEHLIDTVRHVGYRFCAEDDSPRTSA